MGVRRLTSYAYYTKTLWTEIQLKDTLVVMDGPPLYWFLYQNIIDCRCGGEYDEFAKAVRGFFHSLISEGVTPYVLIDGLSLTPTSRTVEDIVRSNKLSVDNCDAFVLPLMVKLAFVQELRKVGIRFVICDGEADQELAALANHWNCPVISEDSDFFIFNLPAGYIPLSSLDFTRRPISARMFKRQRLARHLRIHEDFLPLFASLMGNDYVEEEILAPFKKALFRETDTIRTKTLIMTIANFISRFQSPSDALRSAVDLARASHASEETADGFETDETDDRDKGDLKSAIETSLSKYAISSYSLRGYFDLNETRTRRQTRHHKIIPAYVIRSFRDGRFPVGYLGALVSRRGLQILKAQVEDASEESSHMCSIDIRCISYGIVTEGPTVIECDREQDEMIFRELEPFFGTIVGHRKVPNLKNLRDVDTRRRRRMLLIVLSSKTALIKSLPEGFRLFAASVRFWISRAEPDVSQIWVQALLLVHLKLLAESKQSEKQEERNRRLDVSFDIKCQHSYAQWQSVMMEALMLNQILIFPLPEPDVATLYSGITAQTIAQEIKQGAQVDSFTESVALYSQLYAAVTEGLVDMLV